MGTDAEDAEAPEGWHYSSDPKSIWALPEDIRHVAVTDLFRKHAEAFKSAADREAAAALERGPGGDGIRGLVLEAQEHAVGALGALAGLFPDKSDPAHRLIHSLIGAVLAARTGRANQILLRSTRPIEHNLKGGYGIVLLRAFAIAATNTLCDLGLSDRESRKRIAAILSSAGLSTKKGPHDKPKPVSASAIYSWRQQKMPAAVAVGMLASIRNDIACNNLTSRPEIEGLIDEHARKLVVEARSV